MTTTHPAILHEAGCANPAHSSSVLCRDYEGKQIQPSGGVAPIGEIATVQGTRLVDRPLPAHHDDGTTEPLPDMIARYNSTLLRQARERIDALVQRRLDINAEIKRLRSTVVALEAAQRHLDRIDVDPEEPGDASGEDSDGSGLE